MSIPIFQVDAFTSEPFKGNPAGVCLLDEPRDAQWMRNIAMEMNLAETAFLRAVEDRYELRWFTPTVEVDLCGHATLASAHVLWETQRLAPDRPAHFDTRSGRLTCRRIELSKSRGSESAGFEVQMDFPTVEANRCDAPKDLLDALGLSDALVARSRFDYLVETHSEALVRGMIPDFPMLKRIETRGIIVTAPSSGEFDFVSRFFCPRIGVDEDPVTGSAHCTLAPWWGAKRNKTSLTAYQASARGGIVRMQLQADRTLLSGQAVTTLRGALLH